MKYCSGEWYRMPLTEKAVLSVEQHFCYWCGLDTLSERRNARFTWKMRCCIRTLVRYSAHGNRNEAQRCEYQRRRFFRRQRRWKEEGGYVFDARTSDISLRKYKEVLYSEKVWMSFSQNRILRDKLKSWMMKLLWERVRIGKCKITIRLDEILVRHGMSEMLNVNHTFSLDERLAIEKGTVVPSRYEVRSRI